MLLSDQLALLVLVVSVDFLELFLMHFLRLLSMLVLLLRELLMLISKTLLQLLDLRLESLNLLILHVFLFGKYLQVKLHIFSIFSLQTTHIKLMLELHDAIVEGLLQLEEL